MTLIHEFVIENDALFIADSHFKDGDTNLLEYFANIPKGRQVILMGDIFHLLVGVIHTSCLANMPLIEQIAQLTFTNQVIIIEGNHDFGLKNVWQRYCNYNAANLKIYSYCMQPLVVRGRADVVYVLAHGDLWINSSYDIYRNIVNNPCILFIFRLLDKLSYGIIYRAFAARINQKLIAEFSFFRNDSINFMSHRLAKYESQVLQTLIHEGFATENTRFCIIEGHYHLGGHVCEKGTTYNALQSCYFHKKYLTFKQDEFVIEVVYGTR